MSEKRSLILAAGCAVGAHAVVVAGPLWVVVDEWLTPSVDANIGFGFAVLLLGVIGLPWSIPGWWGFPDLSLDAPVVVAVSVGGAVLNLVLHAGLWWRAHRRVPAPAGDDEGPGRTS